MDGADHSAPCVDGVAHCAHHDGGRPCIQATRWLVLHMQMRTVRDCIPQWKGCPLAFYIREHCELCSLMKVVLT